MSKGKRSNGNSVFGLFYHRGDDASLQSIGPKVPSSGSPDHGQPFAAIFERYNRDFYKIENNDVLVICDDFNLPLAKLRLRAKGSAGGQNGLADVIRRLGTEEVPRLRIGVGAPAERSATSHVLGRFLKDEQPIVAEALDRAVEAAAAWVNLGLEAAMNKYNAE